MIEGLMNLATMRLAVTMLLKNLHKNRLLPKMARTLPEKTTAGTDKDAAEEVVATGLKTQSSKMLSNLNYCS